MKNIKVKLLRFDKDGMPQFLAKLTQRGSKMNCIEDVIKLYDESKNNIPSKELMSLEHGTIKRFNQFVFILYGISTKAVSQLRTHHVGLTFVSTSTQYSEFSAQEMPYLMPNVSPEIEKKMTDAYKTIHETYSQLIKDNVDRDKVGYLLPQGLRKTLIISANSESLANLIKVRICRRNTEELQHIMKLIIKELDDNGITNFLGTLYLPSCVYGKCNEGKFCCGRTLKVEDIHNYE